MDGSGPSIVRGANGRFLPGSSGNPAGKKPGTRNRASLLREALGQSEATEVARVVIDKALGGDAVAARFLLERLEPKPRGRPIELELPAGESAAGDVVALFNSALRALASGEITPAEAVEIACFLEGRYRVLRAWQLEEKLTRWRDCLPVPGDRFVPEGAAERVVDPLKKRSSSPSPSPLISPNIPSPPAQRGERDAQGWRGVAEPYPKLGEGGVPVGKMPKSSIAAAAARTAPPHPAPAKLGDASLSLRNPLPQGERGNLDGEEARSRARARGALTIPADFAISDDVAASIRDRILTIPGVREIAEELRLLPESDLHSTCIGAVSPSISAVMPRAAHGAPTPGSARLLAAR